MESALDVFFNTVRANIISWKAQSITLTNIKKFEDKDTGMICYSSYYEGKLIKTVVSKEVIDDLKAMHGIDIDSTMIEALQHEAVMSTMNYKDLVTNGYFI